MFENQICGDEVTATYRCTVDLGSAGGQGGRRPAHRCDQRGCSYTWLQLDRGCPHTGWWLWDKTRHTSIDDNGWLNLLWWKTITKHKAFFIILDLLSFSSFLVLSYSWRGIPTFIVWATLHDSVLFFYFRIMVNWQSETLMSHILTSYVTNTDLHDILMCSYNVAGATKPRISKMLNVQESKKTWRL